ncbi:ABC transporter permease [Nonomuraea sp. LPB2021202275-12-8]|uniref:ABC transporter permease n=1 Tax=Nonomuraea sp. LPB2021202275-12-8 TaxID=3120159 RepID=UPI00300C7A04
MIDILRSEWTKIRSVRSTVWTLAATALLMVGISVLLTVAISNSGQNMAGDEATRISLAGVLFAQLSIATFGVLVVSSEYRTGAIRTTFMAVPKRLRLLTGKVVVFTVVTLAVCIASTFAAFLLGGQLILGTTSLSEPGAPAAILGSGLYLTAGGLFGLALGALIRHTPGAVVSAIALMYVLPQLTGLLPGQWGATVDDYFTTNAGMEVAIPGQNGSLGPWSGYGVYLVWIAVTLLVAAVLMRRRDA